MSTNLVIDFSRISVDDVPLVGGKNASLGELFNRLGSLGVGVLDGFAITAEAYRKLLAEGGLSERLRGILQGLDPTNVEDLDNRAAQARAAVLATPLPNDLRTAIIDSYAQLCERLGREPELAVRSSATAEDLPEASFAGQQDTFLNVRGVDELLTATLSCFSSLFTARAINYRAGHGFDQMSVALSVGVQPMVRSDRGSAGVIFTLDPESGFRDVVVVSASYGLGEYVVKGVVTPDEWSVFKPTLLSGHAAIIGRSKGSKEMRLVYSDGSEGGTRSEDTTPSERESFCLSDQDVLQLARWACLIEDHYSEHAGHRQPMDIEWARDGIDGALYIVQARPETVHSQKSRSVAYEVYRLSDDHGEPLIVGQAVGEKIGSGPVKVVLDPADLSNVQPGDVLVAQNTDPDWEPVMKRVSAIVTDHGGRTAHAAIVSRELGIPCIVGSGNATRVLHDGTVVTISCAEGSEGHVYEGKIPFEVESLDPEGLPPTHTAVMVNIGDPEQAFRISAVPNSGVGLARMEFIITNHIGIHPMALVRYPALNDEAAVKTISERLGSEQPTEFFVRRLSEGIGRIAAAFYPKPVIVRMSDFKTNEYARLIGGTEFEPTEENPMLGFRGASRYYDPRYAEGFALECAALHRVRYEMGLTNVRVMIPFCRTVEEATKVIAVMAHNGLCQGDEGLEVYAMCEIPANVLLADKFLQIFDGYSIGSNDLTQLVLGIDRDSGTVSHLFDERNDAVRQMIAQAIEAAKRAGRPIGICGQAPSDYPEFAAWLVEHGINSISLNPDAVMKTMLVIAKAESRKTGGTTSA